MLLAELQASEQHHLAPGWAECRAIQCLRFPPLKVQPLHGLGKTLGQQLGKHAFTAHARTKPAVVQLAAPALADQAQYMRSPLRVMVLQPLLEQWRHFQRQAQHHVGRALCAGFPGSLQQAFQFTVIDHRDHRRTQHTHWHTRFAQYPDSPQPCAGRGRAWLQHPLEIIVQRGQADHYPRQALAGHLGQQVEITQHQRTLGDNGHRMAKTQQNLKQPPGEHVLPLDRLVRVGVGAQVDRRAHVARFAQLLRKHVGGVGLGNQLGLEIEAGGKVPIGVRGAGIAVDADVLCYWFHSLRLVKK